MGITDPAARKVLTSYQAPQIPGLAGALPKMFPRVRFASREDVLAKPIKITVMGRPGHDDDAPTVEDLLSQIRDQVDLMREVERAIDPDGKQHLDWRVTNVSKNSPITFELTPTAKNYGTDIDHHVGNIVTTVAEGLKALRNTDKRPKFFNDQAMKTVERVTRRVNNGLAVTEVDFTAYQQERFRLDHETAYSTMSSVERIREPLAKSHRELGSLEGYVKTVGRDGHMRPVLYISSRLDGSEVKCVAKEGGLEKIGHLEVDKVTSGLRVNVFGVMHYKDASRLNRIDVERIDLFDDSDLLPDIRDIVEQNFTDGVEAVEYLKKLRTDG